VDLEDAEEEEALAALEDILADTEDVKFITHHPFTIR
jgi:transcriptional/translational regulatory protein YebC/TACO1